MYTCVSAVCPNLFRFSTPEWPMPRMCRQWNSLHSGCAACSRIFIASHVLDSTIKTTKMALGVGRAICCRGLLNYSKLRCASLSVKQIPARSFTRTCSLSGGGICTTPVPDFEGRPNIKSYKDLQKFTVGNSEEFWSTLARKRLTWHGDFDKVQDCDISQGKISWFLNGKINVSGKNILQPGPLFAPVPLTIFRSNSKFDQNLQYSSLKCTLPTTTKFCTRHDSVTVVTCAKFRCDRLNIFETRALPILIEFRIRSKYR